MTKAGPWGGNECALMLSSPGCEIPWNLLGAVRSVRSRLSGATSFRQTNRKVRPAGIKRIRDTTVVGTTG